MTKTFDTALATLLVLAIVAVFVSRNSAAAKAITSYFRMMADIVSQVMRPLQNGQ